MLNDQQANAQTSVLFISEYNSYHLFWYRINDLYTVNIIKLFTNYIKTYRYLSVLIIFYALYTSGKIRLRMVILTNWKKEQFGWEVVYVLKVRKSILLSHSTISLTLFFFKWKFAIKFKLWQWHKTEIFQIHWFVINSWNEFLKNSELTYKIWVPLLVGLCRSGLWQYRQ